MDTKRQRIIDDISDLLQLRNSEHREYPYGHPKYRPPEGTPLPYIPGLGTRVTVEFSSEHEAKEFCGLFQGLSENARERTMRHLEEIGRIERGI